jgi:hypothetical protein
MIQYKSFFFFWFPQLFSHPNPKFSNPIHLQKYKDFLPNSSYDSSKNYSYPIPHMVQNTKFLHPIPPIMIQAKIYSYPILHMIQITKFSHPISSYLFTLLINKKPFFTQFLLKSSFDSIQSKDLLEFFEY